MGEVLVVAGDGDGDNKAEVEGGGGLDLSSLLALAEDEASPTKSGTFVMGNFRLDVAFVVG